MYGVLYLLAAYARYKILEITEKLSLAPAGTVVATAEMTTLAVCRSLMNTVQRRTYTSQLQLKYPAQHSCRGSITNSAYSHHTQHPSAACGTPSAGLSGPLTDRSRPHHTLVSPSATTTLKLCQSPSFPSLARLCTQRRNTVNGIRPTSLLDGRARTTFRVASSPSLEETRSILARRSNASDAVGTARGTKRSCSA